MSTPFIHPPCAAPAPSLWAFAALMALAMPITSFGKDPTPTSDSDPFPISVSVTPGIVLTGRSGAPGQGTQRADTLVISGLTLVAGQRPIAIAIRSDRGVDLAPLQAAPDTRGAYRLTTPAPTVAGIYEITATAPDGRGKASTRFRAVEPSGLGAQVETVLNEAVAAADDGVKAAQAKVDAQPESPAKEKAKQKIAAAKQALGELRSRTGGAAVRGIIGAISSDAALQEAWRPRLDGITAAVDATSRETERVRKLTATMSSADVGCHQLAFVTEVLKGISALLNVKKKVLDTSIGLAKDIVSDAVANNAKAAGSSAAVAFLRGQAVKNLPEMNDASKLAGNAEGILTDLGAFMTDSLFGIYCEQFVGPLEAVMNARLYFASRAGASPSLYWTYNYKLSGRVVLYYPKSARGGQSIRLNGRIEGYAHSFDTWEDALSVMFPKLMAGAIQRKFNYPPIEVGGTASGIASQGASPMSAYVEGSAAGLALPNSFFIPVEGVLEKDSITVVMGAAKSDIDATHRVAALILSPLTGGLGPQITWYPLGFQKVRPFLVNAADGESMSLKLTTRGDKMLAKGTFTGKVDKPKAKADYTLKITVCNPGC